MIEPAEYEIVAYKGQDYQEEFAFSTGSVPMDLTGYSAKCQIRDKQRQSGTLIAEFSAIVSDPVNGIVTLSLTDAVTAAITARSGYYTLVLIDPSDIDLPYVMGKVIFKDTATVKA